MQAKEVVEGFSEQSKSLSETITGFTKNLTPDTTEMVPADKIEEFTKYYQEQMKAVNL